MPHMCSFKDAWLSDEKFKSWISRDKKSCYYAYCKVCRKSFDVRYMGKSAVTLHMQRKKHKDKLRLSLPTYIHTKSHLSSSVHNISLPNPALTNGTLTTSRSTLNKVSSSNHTSASTYGASSLVQPSDINIKFDPYTEDGTANVCCDSDNDVISKSEHLKENVHVEENYLGTSYIQRPQMAFTPLSANNYDAVSTLGKSSYNRETEFDIWAKSIAKQLNNMNLGRALRLQLKIQSLLTEERLEHEC